MSPIRIIEQFQAGKNRLGGRPSPSDGCVGVELGQDADNGANLNGKTATGRVGKP